MPIARLGSPNAERRVVGSHRSKTSTATSHASLNHLQVSHMRVTGAAADELCGNPGPAPFLIRPASKRVARHRHRFDVVWAAPSQQRPATRTRSLMLIYAHSLCSFTARQQLQD